MTQSEGSADRGRGPRPVPPDERAWRLAPAWDV